MTASHGSTGFGNLFITPLEDLLQCLDPQFFYRKHHQIQSGDGSTTHGINVGERVGCGNTSEPDRIVDRRGYEINRRDNCESIGQTIYRRIITGFKTDEQVGIR